MPPREGGSPTFAMFSILAQARFFVSVLKRSASLCVYRTLSARMLRAISWCLVGGRKLELIYSFPPAVTPPLGSSTAAHFYTIIRGQPRTILRQQAFGKDMPPNVKDSRLIHTYRQFSHTRYFSLQARSCQGARDIRGSVEARARARGTYTHEARAAPGNTDARTIRGATRPGLVPYEPGLWCKCTKSWHPIPIPTCFSKANGGLVV